MTALTTLDLGVLVIYLGGITLWGAWLGRNQTGGSDYFLGKRELPWLAVMLSVVATETSTLTFLSIPGVSYFGTLTFLQLTFGYLIGRVIVAGIMLPAYYRGDLTTAYGLLQHRFGTGARRFTSGVFMITRLLADSVRLFATAIPLALVTGWPYHLSIIVIAAMTVVYTYIGGIRAVVWVDVLQMTLYLAGGVIAVLALQGLVDGGWSGIFAAAGEAGKLTTLDLSTDPGIPYTLWAGVIGGAFLTLGSHGTDQLIVQRLLTCRTVTDSKKALIGSGFAVFLQYGLFLLIGLGLWAFYQARPFERSDEIFARFIVDELPSGVTGLLIAGVFAAAMSSLSSTINSLASATAYDFWGPAKGVTDDAEMLRMGKIFTLIWAALLVGAAILFIPLSEGTTAVEVALAIASLVYGGLVGAFLLGIFSAKADQRSVIIGMAMGIGTVACIWLFWRQAVAWPWFVPIGSLITIVVGQTLGRATGGELEPDSPTSPTGLAA